MVNLFFDPFFQHRELQAASSRGRGSFRFGAGKISEDVEREGQVGRARRQSQRLGENLLLKRFF